MKKYDLINNIVSKYNLEQEINEEVKGFLKEGMTSEDIFNIKAIDSDIVKNAFINQTLEKDFPSMFLLWIIDDSETEDDIDSYKNDIIENLKVDEIKAEEIIKELKKSLYEDTLYKALID